MASDKGGRNSVNVRQLYKAVVPLSLREWIASIPAVHNWQKRKLLEQGERLAAESRKKSSSGGKIRVALLETRRGFWPNHASIYEAMKADRDFDVQVFAVPKRSPAGEMDWDEYQRLEAFFGREGIPFHSAYDPNTKTWNNPLRFGLPDIAFLSQPYDFQQNFLYGSSYLGRFCELAFVSYGLTLVDTPTIFRAPCFENCRYIFFEHEILRSLFLSYSPEHASKLAVTGHPSLDAYLRPLKEKQLIPHKSPLAKFRIVWAPHFTVVGGKTEHQFSNFFEYFDVFVQMAKDHPELEIVMRPHPELFKFMVNSGAKTLREAENYREVFESLPNAFIYEEADYISLFRQSDAIVLDSVGFIGAYAPTGKPVCFLESAKRTRLNSIGERLLHADYAAWNAEEIREFVERVVLGGDDYKRAEREAAVKNLLYIPPEGAGRRIAQELKTRLGKSVGKE